MTGKERGKGKERQSEKEKAIIYLNCSYHYPNPPQIKQ